MDSSGDADAPFPELLDFCSRAQTLVAELLLLSDRLPSQFRDPRFDPVLFDLRYFDSPNEFEASIEENAVLEAIEDELRECCGDYMERFFLFVNAAAVYYLELRKYLDDLKEGVYVQCTFGRALENECGLQLLAESMAFFGCLLLLMEHLMSGFTRERLLVAHMRHYRCSETPNLDILILLCRAHLPAAGSFSHASSPSFSYSMVSIQKADDLFKRFPFPKLVVDAVISRMRDGDMYKQMHHFPDPQHRTVALSFQAGCLYVMLFYSPEFLYNGLIMREIVDRFFKDCWVVPIFFYFSVDLLVSWDAYKEAKTSLSSCLSSTFVRDRSQHYCSQVTILLSELSQLLGNGVLTKDYVLDNSTHLLSLVRNCNITLRWQLLHRNAIEKKFKDIVVSAGLAPQINEDTLLLLLLKSSHLEFEVKQLYAELSEGRQVVWKEKKHRAYDCIQELLVLCDGISASSSKIKNESLKDLLGKLSLETQSLVCTKNGSTGRVIYHIVSALKDIDQHQVEESIQIKLLLSEAQKSLQDMMKVLELDSDTTSTFSTISDALYAWGYIAKLSKLFRKKIEQDPPVLLVLHMFFLKFKTVLSAPLMRIKQNQSLDLLCISQYYSSKYEAQICSTLEIVPVMILRIFSEVGFQTGQPFQLLNRVDNDNLHNFMQLEPQLNLVKTMSKVSVLSKGIMVMSRNFRGVINLDFNDWLERQIRRQLLKLIENKVNSFFSSANDEAEKLEANLKTLSNYIFSHSHMMESFQGLLHLNGCHIWEETFTKVLKQCSQREHAKFMEIKQKSMTSPTFTRELPVQTFFGRLLCQILQLTDPSQSMFLEPLSGWFDAEGRELLGLHFFDLLYSCVGQVGLASLDSLLRSLLKKNLEHAMTVSKHLLDAGCLEEIHKLDDSLGPAASHPLFGCLSYKQMIKIVTKSWDPWVETLALIGQLQLLRCLVSLKLKSACKVNAEAISFAAEGMMTSIYSQREMIYKCQETKGEDDAVVRHFLESLKKQQNLCGFSSPLHTLYITDNPPCMGRFAFIFSITQLSHYVLDMHLGVLTSRSKKSITDFSPLVIGLGTFLYQFHPSLTSQYLQYMGQYVRITAEGALYKPQKEYTDTSSEVQKSAFWLMYFCKYMGVPKDVVDSCLPPSLVAILQT